MSRARSISKILDLPENASQLEIEHATLPYLNQGWSIKDTWMAGGFLHVMLVKILTN